MTPEQEERVRLENEAFHEMVKTFYTGVRAEITKLGYETEDFVPSPTRVDDFYRNSFQFKGLNQCWVFSSPILQGPFQHSAREKKTFVNEIEVSVRSNHGRSYTWKKRPEPSKVAAMLVKHYEAYLHAQKMRDERQARYESDTAKRDAFKKLLKGFPSPPPGVLLTATPEGIRLEVTLTDERLINKVLAPLFDDRGL